MIQQEIHIREDTFLLFIKRWKSNYKVISLMKDFYLLKYSWRHEKLW